jgi:phage gp36-like protein
MGTPYVYASNGNEYIVQSDILAALDPDVITQLSDDDSNGVIDATVMARAITAARSVVESYCARSPRNYPIPLINSDGEVPELVREYNITIAAYKLFGHRFSVPESIQAAYDATIDRLKAIAMDTPDAPILIATPTIGSTRKISGNMAESDLGKNTMNDGQDTITWGDML